MSRWQEVLEMHYLLNRGVFLPDLLEAWRKLCWYLMKNIYCRWHTSDQCKRSACGMLVLFIVCEFPWKPISLCGKLISTQLNFIFLLLLLFEAFIFTSTWDIKFIQQKVFIIFICLIEGFWKQIKSQLNEMVIQNWQIGHNGLKCDLDAKHTFRPFHSVKSCIIHTWYILTARKSIRNDTIMLRIWWSLFSQFIYITEASKLTWYFSEALNQIFLSNYQWTILKWLT